MAYIIPSNDGDRLRALNRYDILDSEPEEAFDRITRLASSLLDAPIALVSLVDAARQWFKSRVGLDAVETPREFAFCHHAIQAEGLFVVSDATRDQRFAANPLVTGAPDIRFYAGAPLVTGDGHRLGTLCVIDREPRSLSARDAAILSDLAALVMDEMELRLAGYRARHELAERERQRAEMARLAEESRQAREAAEQALAAKLLFHATLTHELRTPLTAVIGFSELMENGIHGPLGNERYRDYAATIGGSARHLLELINDMLDVSRIEAGRFEVETRRVSPRTLAEQALRMARGLAYEKGIDIRLQEGNWPDVVADPRAVKHILLNLLSNAVKFSPAKHGVMISAEALEDRLVLRVADEGRGIPAADLERLGRPYEQAAGTTGGTGLGLALCRHLAEEQGGRLVIASTPGRGTTVSFDLPLALVAAE
ncbi:MAG TPA: GAF domain-containing sensor histidine kinase [Azospirillaceae bacterium]|nr:GAF domain-containing sensor histidine kinase [Azospirillaceae bacterium]